MAQNNKVLRGVIYDSTDNKAIANVAIKNKNGNVIATTNNNGRFRLEPLNFPYTIEVSHISYQSKKITFTKACDSLKISLSQKTNDLPAFAYKTNKPEAITKDKPIFIWDYTFQGKDIILLAYKNKNVLHPALYLLNENGDSLYSTDVKQAQNLITDGLYNNHLLTRSMAFQILYDSSNFKLQYPNTIEDFHKNIDPFVAACNDHYFFKQYYYNKQLLIYYDYNKANDSATEFASIEDAKGKRMFRDFPRMIRSKGFNENDLRFETEIMYKPVYAPLFVLKDTIFIFNHQSGNIETYRNQGKPIKETAITYQNDEDWAKQLIVDYTTKDVYAVFKKKNSISLGKIDLKTGKIAGKTTIPDLIFIEKIQINNGDVYFLYKNFINDDFKRLYKMKL